ncbi:RnfH family protein [Candidatus Sororendozoicomonas aggregata]|uniref:RnfH family protein n=1 Tax=Candidatus Sororendozoicomonas aggregata TaxID=3073239 RepID=UPI002ED27A95
MDNPDDQLLSIEVAFATPSRQKILTVQVREGTTVFEAAQRSGIVECFSEIVLESAKVGIFGKVVSKPKEQTVKKGDRVEIYRPLIADPREVRKRRAEKARQKKQMAL